MSIPSDFTEDYKNNLNSIYLDHQYVDMRDLYAVITRAYQMGFYFLAEYMEREYSTLQSNWDDILIYSVGTSSFGEGNVLDD